MLVIQGAIFVITVPLFRRGILGEIIAFANRWRGSNGKDMASGEVPAHG